MKVRKILALVATAALSVSTLTAITANAETITDQKVLDVACSYTLTDEDLTGLELDAAAYDGYIVDFNVTNLDITGEKKKVGLTNYYVGQSVVGSVIQFDVSCSKENFVMNEDVMVVKYSSDFTEEEPQLEGNTITAYFGGTKALFPNASKLSIAAADKTLIYQALVVVPEGESATLTFLDGCAVNTLGFDTSGAIPTAAIDYKTAGIVSTPALTLGEVAPEEPDVPEDTKKDVQTGAFKFTVGPKYNGNEGFKVYFNKTENGAKSTVYGELAKEKILGESEVQADMDVTVGVLVKGVPSNVVLEFLRAEWLETLTK